MTSASWFLSPAYLCGLWQYCRQELTVHVDGFTNSFVILGVNLKEGTFLFDNSCLEWLFVVCGSKRSLLLRFTVNGGSPGDGIFWH